MMFHAHVPLKLWVEAFITVIYLLNWLPTITLRHDTPYYQLFKKHPNYVYLRVFGCRCYPYLQDYAKNKFSQKTLPCVFVGYNFQHKGFRCLHSSTNRIYISRYVVFDETHLHCKFSDRNQHL